MSPPRSIQMLLIGYSGCEPFQGVFIRPDLPPSSKCIAFPCSGKSWLDIRQGDAILVRDEQVTVTSVVLQSAQPETRDMPEIVSGRHWLATGETLASHTP